MKPGSSQSRDLTCPLPARRSLLTVAAGLLALAAGVVGAPGPASAADNPAGAPELTVLAASSLTDALGEVAQAYTHDTGRHLRLSFAASSALARQIESGAPADVFFSADTDWMDYLQRKKLLDAASRTDVVRNRLVLIAPAGSTARLAIAPHFALAAALGGGRLSTGDPASVPVGRYARAALTHLQVWDQVKDRIAAADNVRVALSYVARGETPLGIVYRTDALVEKQVRIVAEFPADSHEPIVYPAAATAGAQAGAADFVRYLKTAPAQAIFRRYGFE